MKLLVGPGLRDPAGNEAFLVKALRKVADVKTFEPSHDSIETVLRGLPQGWSPDAILVRDAEFYKVPRDLERVEVPVFALVGDYNLSLYSMLPILGSFDHFFCDSKGVRIFKKLGFDNCEFFCLYGYDPEIHRDYGLPRQWDVVFVGNLNHAVQQRRESSLHELAQLGRHFRVHITTGVYGEPYARLLNSARLVFNRSIRDEVNMRFFEAIGCGAVVMNERLSELDLMGFDADRHFLESTDIGGAVNRFFHHFSETDREELRSRACSALKNHSYDRRAEDLVRKIQSTGVDITKRPNRGLSGAELHRRWSHYYNDRVTLPSGGEVSTNDPLIVKWQKHLVQNELEIRNFDFPMWLWWADLLAVAGLDRFLGQFYIEKELLLSAFGCYGQIAEYIRRRRNKLIYGFAV